MATWVSLVFWVIVIAWSARAIGSNGRIGQFPDGERLLPLIYPLLYGAAVFSVFESGSRQHMAAAGVLLVLAASSVTVPSVKRNQPRAKVPPLPSHP